MTTWSEIPVEVRELLQAALDHGSYDPADIYALALTHGKDYASLAREIQNFGHALRETHPADSKALKAAAQAVSA